MGDRKWKLGEDLSTYDNLIDPVTLQDLITAVHCNCRRTTSDAVRETMKQIIEMRLEDTMFLVENNLDEICREAMKGRDLK